MLIRGVNCDRGTFLWAPVNSDSSFHEQKQFGYQVVPRVPARADSGARNNDHVNCISMEQRKVQIKKILLPTNWTFPVSSIAVQSQVRL